MPNSEQHASVIPPLKLLLTVDEAAATLSLGRTYVYHLVMCNEIASVKVGRKRRVPLSALQEFVAHRLAEVKVGI